MAAQECCFSALVSNKHCFYCCNRLEKGVKGFTHLCGSQHGRAEVDGTSGLEVELELGLALPVSVRLRDHFAPNVVGPKDRLLKFNFSQGLQEQEELAQPHL
jgi:hypothetical protein